VSSCDFGQADAKDAPACPFLSAVNRTTPLGSILPLWVARAEVITTRVNAGF